MRPCPQHAGVLNAIRRGGKYEKLRALTLLSSRVFVLELGQVIHILVDDDVEAVGLVVGGHVGHREALRHGCK